MEKLYKEDAGAGVTQSKSVGRKRDMGWKIICIVSVMGLLCLLQLVVVENRWYWTMSSRHEPSPYASRVFGDSGKSSTSSVLANSSSQSALQSKSPPCTSDCASKNELEEKRNDDGTHEERELPADEIGGRKNEKLSEFKAENTFLPMKDVTEAGLSDTDTNWFMSGLRGITTPETGETIDLPRDDPEGRILCVRGNDPGDGTKNGYGLFRATTLPKNAIFLGGTTFIADNYWDYHNPWHAMSALVNFATWRLGNKCGTPDRLMIYHMGELLDSMGSWIAHILHATFMKAVPLETLKTPKSIFCFQRAVIQRRGLGGLDKPHITALFDMLRCKVRRYCGIRLREARPSSPEVLLFTRSGARAFANETGVVAVVQNECSKVPGCNLRVLNSGKLTFCEQVEAMSGTDVLISAHGAHLTNMMFMSPGSRLMELFPKGWLEFAGIGQEVFKWESDWTRLIHAGRWRDPEGPECPYPTSETLACLLFFKDREVGLNETHLALWTRSVLAEHVASEALPSEGESCACDEKNQGSFEANFATNSKSQKLQ